MGEIIIGSEAVVNGIVTRRELRRGVGGQGHYRPLYPNVHRERGRDPSLHDRTAGAWLWSKRNGIITGVAASALHGAEWVDDDVPVELLWNSTHPPDGIIVRNERTSDDEWEIFGGLRVATPARTAFDLGRYLRRDRALARLDALMRAAPFSIEDVMLLTKRYQGARGVAKLKAVLPLVDGGAASPPESRLRLLFIDAGLPKPTTQIVIYDECGRYVRTIDMGWEDFNVGAEYDGDQHRTSRTQYVKDLRVWPKLAALGWHVVRAIKEDRDADLVRQAWDAMVARGWRPT
ncbi:hypothetical protein [Mycobacterium sp. ACS1612]|uniref:hypothetical protein n=1 Tax=Mycobacterium sp. ACS1612 TaxID=1834117 RepID=UPI0018D3219E|nr:hypothetical protein [Mycobacterium sp. ACS1612]